MSGGMDEEQEAVEDGGNYLVIEYEDDPVEGYDTRRLVIGLGIAFVFGFVLGLALLFGILQPGGVFWLPGL